MGGDGRFRSAVGRPDSLWGFPMSDDDLDLSLGSDISLGSDDLDVLDDSDDLGTYCEDGRE